MASDKFVLICREYYQASRTLNRNFAPLIESLIWSLTMVKPGDSDEDIVAKRDARMHLCNIANVEFRTELFTTD